MPPAGLSVPRLRACVGRMLSEPRYRVKARYWKAKIARADGFAQAANIVEQAIAKRQPAPGA